MKLRAAFQVNVQRFNLFVDKKFLNVQVTNHRYLVEFSQKEELSAEDLASNAADKQESDICHTPEEDPVGLTSNEDVRDQDDKTMVKYFRSSRILKKIDLENFQTSTKLEALVCSAYYSHIANVLFFGFLLHCYILLSLTFSYALMNLMVVERRNKIHDGKR